jgi:enoyl-CoA hydratase/carnithine racemase
VPGEAGLLLAMTGAIVNEADALYARLADHCVAQARQPEFMQGLVGLDWSGSVATQSARLRAFCTSFAAQAPVTLPESGLQTYHDLIRSVCMRPDAQGVLAGLKAAAAVQPWFAKPYENLAAGSPTAASVTYEYMRRCRPLGISDVLALDLVVAKQCQRHPDFPEGVRALLIDKSRDAKWSPVGFEGVSETLVKAFFV